MAFCQSRAMAISDLTAKQYDAIAKLRADIVRLLDEAFGNNYVVVVGYWRDPDGPGGWWNKRFGPEESPETIRKFIAVSREAEAQMHHVRNMAEWDAWLLYNQESEKARKTLADYEVLIKGLNAGLEMIQKQSDTMKQEFHGLLEKARQELESGIQIRDERITELRGTVKDLERRLSRRRRRAGPSPR